MGSDPRATSETAERTRAQGLTPRQRKHQNSYPEHGLSLAPTRQTTYGGAMSLSMGQRSRSLPKSERCAGIGSRGATKPSKAVREAQPPFMRVRTHARNSPN